jgi:hypothetical protein
MTAPRWSSPGSFAVSDEGDQDDEFWQPQRWNAAMRDPRAGRILQA